VGEHRSLHQVASAANPRVKMLRALGGSRGVRRHHRALVCGRRIVDEVLRRHRPSVESLVYPSGHPAVAELGDDVASSSPELVVLQPALYREIDPFGVEPPLAVVRVEPPPPWDAERERRGLTLFLPLGDPENAGAALRSAAAFGVDRVVLLAEAAHPFHPRAIRASAGACFDVELRAGPPLAELLASPPEGLDLCVLDRDGEPLDAIEPSPELGLVVGEEGGGLPVSAGTPRWRRVAIPIAAGVDSLNAAVAVGIALWELRRRLDGAGRER
jgi:tRNA G18 (ribose-2'-O)-methylase SpoU